MFELLLPPGGDGAGGMWRGDTISGAGSGASSGDGFADWSSSRSGISMIWNGLGVDSGVVELGVDGVNTGEAGIGRIGSCASKAKVVASDISASDTTEDDGG